MNTALLAYQPYTRRFCISRLAPTTFNNQPKNAILKCNIGDLPSIKEKTYTTTLKEIYIYILGKVLKHIHMVSCFMLSWLGFIFDTLFSYWYFDILNSTRPLLPVHKLQYILKGTVQRDFRPPVLFIIRTSLGYWPVTNGLKYFG